MDGVTSCGWTAFQSGKCWHVTLKRRGTARDETERGSIMMIVATDAPLLDRGLRRLARRAGIGLARTGSIAGNGSGDYVIAFSTSERVRIPHEPDGLTQTVEIVFEDGPAIDGLFQAVVEADGGSDPQCAVQSDDDDGPRWECA